MTRSTVYCAECGAPMERKESEIRRNTTGLYFCNTAERDEYFRRTAFHLGRPQQRGWRRGATA